MKNLFLFCSFLMLPLLLTAQIYEDTGLLPSQNKPEREEWLKDAGFGMFIHWSFDSQLGIVISHSMVGASEDYIDRYINELPKTFDPYQYEPRELARLAKLAGMKYVVFTTKHHSGFCMWDTETTDFNIMNTPYGKDIVADYVKAVREFGLGVGFYYSPEDFWFLHTNGQTIRRRGGEPLPKDVLQKYKAYIADQCTELMTQYGKIDVMFFDGELKDTAAAVCWRLQPDILITRGVLNTPEQNIPGLPSEDTWEACITMGTQWAYKPTNDDYKSAARQIELLIETRAKGGALLLNVGPKPDGQLPIEQEERLREVAAWNFINGEAIANVRPWILTNEEDIWFAKHKSEPTVYAFLTRRPEWPRGERRSFVLHSVRATPQTTVEILGQSSKLVEYQPQTDPRLYFEQKEDGLHISCVRAHRIYNNHRWHNPLVLKITNAEAALDPPFVETLPVERQGVDLLLQGRLVKAGDGADLQFGFEYRPYLGFAENLNSAEDWQKTGPLVLDDFGRFQAKLSGLASGAYEYRAVVKHPKMQVPGDVRQFTVE